MKAAVITAALFAASITAGWAAVPRNREPVRDLTATVEVNRFYNEQGSLIFTQLIWLDESGVVIAWRLVKTPSMLPALDRPRGEYVVTWHDGEVLREVRSRSLKETWTQYDPEVQQRDVVPQCRRRELTAVK